MDKNTCQNLTLEMLTSEFDVIRKSVKNPSQKILLDYSTFKRWLNSMFVKTTKLFKKTV